MSDPNLLDGDEAGEVLRMLPKRVARLARRGVLPHVALPDGELRFLRTDLMAWASGYRKAGAVVDQPGGTRPSPANERRRTAKRRAPRAAVPEAAIP